MSTPIRPFSAMTLNLRRDYGEDGWFDARRSRREAVVAVIRSHEPDILAVQEGLAPQIADLEAALPGHRRIGVGRDDGAEGGEHVALFICEARFSLERHGAFWLGERPEVPGSIAPGARFPRPVAWARVRDLEADRVCWFASAHWPHRSPQARRAAAAQISAWIATQGGLEGALLGDLNCGASSAPVRVLRREGLIDAYAALHPIKARCLGTWHGDRGFRIGPRIDHALCTRGLRPLQARILHDRPGRWPSDHFPLWVELR